MLAELIDPERSLIASMFFDAKVARNAHAMVDRAWLTNPDAAGIFAAISKLALADELPTYPAVAREWARATNRDTDEGFLDASQRLVHYLEEAVGVRENTTAYVRMLRDDYERRRIGTTALEIHDDSRSPAAQPEELSEAMRQGAKLSRPLVRRVMREDEVPEQDRGGRAMIATGFLDLDHLLSGGIRGGQAVVVAGRTSMGKTAFMLDLARHMSSDGIKIGIVTLEMTPAALNARLRKIERSYEAAPIWFINSVAAGMKLDQIAGEAQDLAMQGMGCLMVDHLQIVRLPAAENRHRELATAMRGLKELAIRLDIPVVVLSQLSRSTDDHRGAEPRLSDLRESGAIEEEADIVLLLHRAGYYDKTADPAAAGVHLAKNREGRTGRVRLTWRGELASYASFTEAS